MGVAAGNNEYENPIVLEDVDRTIIGTDECLQLILNVLPDISIDYALGLIIEQTEDGTRCSADCERLIMMLLDQGAYPKEADEVNKRKRKRDNGDADGEVAGDLATSDPDYLKDALDLLKDEFQYAPVPHIRNTLAQEGTLLKAFVVIEQQLRVYDKSSSRSIKKIQKPRARGDFTTVLAHKPIIRELEAARARIAKDAAKRQEEVEQKHAEERNIELAKRNNEMNDCLCCFDEYPLNRMVSCDGDVIHLFCRECARRYVEEEMSKSRCRPICFADPNCGGTFTRQQLLQFLGPKTFERLEHLQQQEDVAAAGLEDLCDCPFCDFKQECPPVEVDREFRCLNPTCGKTSCRFCNTETHIPKTCEEAKKDKNISVRHTVEEAKSEALIRNCNNCKSPFVKDEGCNKMTCTKCRNVQCYVCSKNVTDYNHFGSNDNRNRCPLHDNVEKRHQDEIKKAEADALARIRAEHPDIPEEELQIKVSDVVKASEQARQGRAEAQHNGFGFQMNGPNLVRAPQIPPHIGLPIEVPPWNPIPFQPNPPAPPAPAPAPAPAPRPVLQPNAPEAFGVGQLVGQLRYVYIPRNQPRPPGPPPPYYWHANNQQ
ncbi:hypothetical protein P154DRAFT_442343 [Amniculicola lignicola CBS 123094]|uniref:RING-type domain-containing protein n=1 Tax=Amniculicola lignicola CBS 123094 TaxID=1392246 RepID=A0A6A5W6Z4_9PLEO|nr:hypothetical protein P154DRAFT_442343 [Amniculicola lignicola CBS 123094]